MGPWIDRDKLISNAKRFVRLHGYFFSQNAKRISSLVEISVYNSVVQFYKDSGFQVCGENLGPRNSFRYKLTATGLTDNYSYFIAKKGDTKLYLLHNILLQSAHNAHLYFTADVGVAAEPGPTTQRLKNGRRHSFIASEDMLTFVEVKHLNPFPEVLFNFMGLVLEFMPGFVRNEYDVDKDGYRLCPSIAFTGSPSDHAERIRESLCERYGINIVFGTSRTMGRVADFSDLNRYSRRIRKEALKVHDE